MAENALAAVAPSTAAIGATAGDFGVIAGTSGFDFDPGAGTLYIFPDYLRQEPTKCNYEWNAAGRSLHKLAPNPFSTTGFSGAGRQVLLRLAAFPF